MTDVAALAPVGETEGRGRWSSPLGGIAVAVVRALRPRQWAKNALVLAAPGAAGALVHLHPLLRSLGAAGIFCLTAGGAYILNDLLDAAEDRRHPTKRQRPVAAGALSPKVAWPLAPALLAAGVALAWTLAGAPLALVMALYVAVNVSYSLWLRREAVLDIAAVASGFVLRAVAGGIAAGVVLSDWFLIVACFGSLFVVAGKRHAEAEAMSSDHAVAHHGHHRRESTLNRRAASRRPLALYSEGFLRQVRTIAAAVAVTAYCLWAFERGGAEHAPLLFELSIAPFVIGMLRYALLVELGHGGAPEDVVLADRGLQIAGAAWIALVAVGVYAH